MFHTLSDINVDISRHRLRSPARFPGLTFASATTRLTEIQYDISNPKISVLLIPHASEQLVSYTRGVRGD